MADRIQLGSRWIGVGEPAYLIAEAGVNLPFLSRLACRKKPLILPTGMATLAEVEAAVAVMEQAGHTQIMLLHVSADTRRTTPTSTCAPCGPLRPPSGHRLVFPITP